MTLRLLMVSVWLAAPILIAGCGSSSSSPSAPSSTSNTSTGSSSAATINIVGQNGTQAFTPNPAVLGGQQVVFKNTDSVVHRVILNDGSIDTGDIAPGATSRTLSMPSTGTNYHCAIHPGMIGSVAGQSTPPPACEGQYCVGY